MEKYKKNLIAIIAVFATLISLTVFDKVLGIGLAFCAFLGVITWFSLFKFKIGDKRIYTLFLIAFLIHIAASCFVNYTGFQPFGNGSGDFVEYHQNAKEIYTRIHNGDFSVGGLERTSHYYSVVLGYIYTFTVPEMLVGQLFNAWLTALVVLLTYFIVVEIFGSKKSAFLVGLIVSFYPSLTFYGSLLLKDVLVTFLSLLGVLLTIKLIKDFKYSTFAIFYLTSGVLLHFRFYIGFAMLFTFIFCWTLFSNTVIKKRILYILIAIALFGFLPQLFVVDDTGYWGYNLFKQYLNQKTISYYREYAYAPISIPADTSSTDTSSTDTSGSTFDIDTNFSNPILFIKGYATSFVYAVLSPLPWQIKYKRQMLSFVEMIPLYFLLFFSIKGMIRGIKTNYKVFAPLLVFSLFIIGNIALFINNFGIITRIRIPAIICLLCFLPFGFEKNGVIHKYLCIGYNKYIKIFGRNKKIC